jgi:hypothetical protein
MDGVGNALFRDEDWVVIYSQGGKDKVEKKVSDWIATLEMHLSAKRVSIEYVRQVKAAYEEFKAGRELPLNGTPLEALGLTTDQLKMLRELKVRAVEDLAGANEEVVARMGMGGRALKSRAQVFVQSANGPAKVASQVTALKIKTDSQEDIIRQLEARITRLSEENALLRQAPAVGGGAQVDLGDPAERLARMQDEGDDDSVVDEALGS